MSLRKYRRKLRRLAPKIADILGLPKRPFTLEWTDEGVAATDAAAGRIFLGRDYFRQHPDDIGALAHEYAHLVQNVPGGYDGPCGKWIEPMADYVRYTLGLYDPSWWKPSTDVLELAELSANDLREFSRSMAAGLCS